MKKIKTVSGLNRFICFNVKKHNSFVTYTVVIFLTLIKYCHPIVAYAGNIEPIELINEASSGIQKTPSELSQSFLEEAVQAEILWLDYSEEITIATRHETPIHKAPSTVTVISAEEIRNSGYRTFSEVLRIIPGFELLKAGDFGEVFPTVRGLKASNRIRVMINGHLVNNPLRGEAFGDFDDFPLHIVKKIEVIRGPGSALYGENAFLAAINIITYEAADIDGIRIESNYGSFDTREGNMVFGKNIGDLEVSGMIHYRETNGYDGTVESDSQTITDNELLPFGVQPASEAPGEVEDWRREYDLNLMLRYKDVYIQALYINKNRGPFIGPQFALTNESDVESNYVFCEVGYTKRFDDQCILKPRAYYDQFDNDTFIESLPEGATIPFDTDGDDKFDFLRMFPEGLIGNGIETQRIAGAEIPLDYQLFDGNIVTVGFEYRFISQTNIQYFANFHPVTFDPLNSVQDFSDTFPLLKDTTRNIWSFYVQDTWDINDSLNITLGARFDEYSDFGDEISPRLGLTWSFLKNATLKLLYGEAFRAPSFIEMFTVNQPAIIGNEDLDPEEIKTYEIGFQYKFNTLITSGITYFHNDIEDLIVLRTLDSVQETSRFENFGNAHINGIEAETRIDFSGGNYIFMNYTFQDAQDDNGNNLPFVAKHKGNFGVNVHPCEYINVNLSSFVSGKRYREDEDSRDDLPSYALMNVSVIAKEFLGTMELQGAVYNLLDKDYDDPGPTLISGDLPRPGRTFFINLSYQF